MSRDIKRAMADEVVAKTKEIVELGKDEKANDGTSRKERKVRAERLLKVIYENVDHATYSDVRADLNDCAALLEAIAI